MSSSNRKRFAVMIAMASAGTSMADTIALTGDARLSGTVSSISKEGVVELQTALAAEPVLLKSDAVRKVTFTETAASGKIPSSRVELINGDVLPVEIESLDDQRLNVISPMAGKLQIPRSALKSLMLGISPNRVIFTGPKNENDLKPEGPHGDNWSFDSGVLSVQGSGRVSKKLEPAKQFIARFTMEWENNPQIQFYFADPLTAASQPSDRYLFQFNAGGVEIKREAAKSRRATTIITLNRRPEQFPDNRLKVEIRVDRESSMLYLFLNDEPEGRYSDPVENTPAGGGIAFVSASGNESEVRLSGIEVLEWDHTGDRHRTEDRGDLKTDSLIEKRGDRFGGKLISIRPGAGGPLFSFKSDFQEAPIELPESDVSTVFFQHQEAEKDQAFHPFSLKLAGDGVLQVSECSFPGEKIEVTHPLLGPLTFSRSGVTALERMEKKGGKP